MVVCKTIRPQHHDHRPSLGLALRAPFSGKPFRLSQACQQTLHPRPRSQAVQSACPSGAAMIWVIDPNSARDSRPVAEEPCVQITDWRALQSDEALFLVGARAQQSRFRFSTAIQALDPAARTATTASGRVYELMGAPTRDPDLIAQMTKLARYRGMLEVTDATHEIWSALLAATH
jgi:hypothetical protein